MSRRSYAGGVKGVTLTATATDVATSLSVNTLVGVPDGSGGPFALVVGKGGPNEEKMLASSAGGGIIVISQRGYDGTSPKPHSAGEEVRLVGTAIDFDEANAHIQQTAGVHGLSVGDSIVGAARTQTLTGKTMDGGQNTFTNLPLVAMPAIVAELDAEEVARAAGDTNRYTKAESDARYALTGAPADAVAAHVALSDPHAQYLEGDGTASNRLKIADLPSLSSGRHWSAPIVPVVVTDASPGPTTISTVVIPAAAANPIGGTGRLFAVTVNIKGFITTGTGTDTARARVLLNIQNSGGAVVGNIGTFLSIAPADAAEWNTRLPGGVSIPADGLSGTAYAFITTNDTFGFRASLAKISGVNTENSDVGSLSVVQLV